MDLTVRDSLHGGWNTSPNAFFEKYSFLEAADGTREEAGRSVSHVYVAQYFDEPGDDLASQTRRRVPGPSRASLVAVKEIIPIEGVLAASHARLAATSELDTLRALGRHRHVMRLLDAYAYEPSGVEEAAPAADVAESSLAGSTGLRVTIPAGPGGLDAISPDKYHPWPQDPCYRLVMPLARGDLKKWIQHYVFPHCSEAQKKQKAHQSGFVVSEPLAADLLYQIALGVEHTHKAGYINRDWKLENVLVFREPQGLECVEWMSPCSAGSSGAGSSGLKQAMCIGYNGDFKRTKGQILQPIDITAAALGPRNTKHAASDTAAKHAHLRIPHLVLGDFGTARREEFATRGAHTAENVPPEHVWITAPYSGPKYDSWLVGIILANLLLGSGLVCDIGWKNAARSAKSSREDANALNVPEGCGLSESAVDILRGLLDTNPDTRMGIPELLAHPWMRPARERYHAAEAALLFESEDGFGAGYVPLPLIPGLQLDINADGQRYLKLESELAQQQRAKIDEHWRRIDEVEDSSASNQLNDSAGDAAALLAALQLSDEAAPSDGHVPALGPSSSPLLTPTHRPAQRKDSSSLAAIAVSPDFGPVPRVVQAVRELLKHIKHVMPPAAQLASDAASSSSSGNAGARMEDFQLSPWGAIHDSPSGSSSNSASGSVHQFRYQGLQEVQEALDQAQETISCMPDAYLSTSWGQVMDLVTETGDLIAGMRGAAPAPQTHKLRSALESLAAALRARCHSNNANDALFPIFQRLDSASEHWKHIAGIEAYARRIVNLDTGLGSGGTLHLKLRQYGELERFIQTVCAVCAEKNGDVDGRPYRSVRLHLLKALSAILNGMLRSADASEIVLQLVYNGLCDVARSNFRLRSVSSTSASSRGQSVIIDVYSRGTLDLCLTAMAGILSNRISNVSGRIEDEQHLAGTALQSLLTFVPISRDILPWGMLWCLTANQFMRSRTYAVTSAAATLLRCALAAVAAQSFTSDSADRDAPVLHHIVPQLQLSCVTLIKHGNRSHFMALIDLLAELARPEYSQLRHDLSNKYSGRSDVAPGAADGSAVAQLLPSPFGSHATVLIGSLLDALAVLLQQQQIPEACRVINLILLMLGDCSGAVPSCLSLASRVACLAHVRHNDVLLSSLVTACHALARYRFDLSETTVLPLLQLLRVCLSRAATTAPGSLMMMADLEWDGQSLHRFRHDDPHLPESGGVAGLREVLIRYSGSIVVVSACLDLLADLIDADTPGYANSLVATWAPTGTHPSASPAPSLFAADQPPAAAALSSSRLSGSRVEPSSGSASDVPTVTYDVGIELLGFSPGATAALRSISNPDGGGSASGRAARLAPDTPDADASSESPALSLAVPRTGKHSSFRRERMRIEQFTKTEQRQVAPLERILEAEGRFLGAAATAATAGDAANLAIELDPGTVDRDPYSTSPGLTRSLLSFIPALFSILNDRLKAAYQSRETAKRRAASLGVRATGPYITHDEASLINRLLHTISRLCCFESTARILHRCNRGYAVDVLCEMLSKDLVRDMQFDRRVPRFNGASEPSSASAGTAAAPAPSGSAAVSSHMTPPPTLARTRTSERFRPSPAAQPHLGSPVIGSSLLGLQLSGNVYRSTSDAADTASTPASTFVLALEMLKFLLSSSVSNSVKVGKEFLAYPVKACLDGIFSSYMSIAEATRSGHTPSVGTPAAPAVTSTPTSSRQAHSSSPAPVASAAIVGAPSTGAAGGIPTRIPSMVLGTPGRTGSANDVLSPAVSSGLTTPYSAASVSRTHSARGSGMQASHSGQHLSQHAHHGSSSHLLSAAQPVDLASSSSHLAMCTSTLLVIAQYEIDRARAQHAHKKSKSTAADVLLHLSRGLQSPGGNDGGDDDDIDGLRNMIALKSFTSDSENVRNVVSLLGCDAPEPHGERLRGVARAFLLSAVRLDADAGDTARVMTLLQRDDTKLIEHLVAGLTRSAVASEEFLSAIAELQSVHSLLRLASEVYRLPQLVYRFMFHGGVYALRAILASPAGDSIDTVGSIVDILNVIADCVAEVSLDDVDEDIGAGNSVDEGYHTDGSGDLELGDGDIDIGFDLSADQHPNAGATADASAASRPSHGLGARGRHKRGEVATYLGDEGRDLLAQRLAQHLGARSRGGHAAPPGAPDAARNNAGAMRLHEDLQGEQRGRGFGTSTADPAPNNGMITVTQQRKDRGLSSESYRAAIMNGTTSHQQNPPLDGNSEQLHHNPLASDYLPLDSLHSLVTAGIVSTHQLASYGIRLAQRHESMETANSLGMSLPASSPQLRALNAHFSQFARQEGHQQQLQQQRGPDVGEGNAGDMSGIELPFTADMLAPSASNQQQHAHLPTDRIVQAVGQADISILDDSTATGSSSHQHLNVSFNLNAFADEWRPSTAADGHVQDAHGAPSGAPGSHSDAAFPIVAARDSVTTQAFVSIAPPVPPSAHAASFGTPNAAAGIGAASSNSAHTSPAEHHLPPPSEPAASGNAGHPLVGAGTGTAPGAAGVAYLGLGWDQWDVVG